MFDWHVQAYLNGKPHEKPSTQSSAESAIETGNEILRGKSADEVTIYHRLHSNQACLSYRTAIPTDEIRLKAAHLERQAQFASKRG